MRKLYKTLRKIANNKQKSFITKLLFDIGVTPSVLKHGIKNTFPNGEKGGFIISADFEMAWAFRYSKNDVDPIEKAMAERKNIPVMLRLFERYNIPITWATVGHLFLTECKKGDHDWMARIPHFDDHWKFTEGDWFDHDPYSNYKKDPAWYAPDMVDLILNSSIKHEIGCHTFSHIDCLYKNCPAQVLEDELKACQELADKNNIRLKSLVFPGGTAGNYEVLKKLGYKIYRKNIKYNLVYPYRDKHGLLVTASTSSWGRNANWTQEYYIKRYKKIINKAIQTNTIAHIWLHPSIDEWTLINVIPKVLEYAAKRRDENKLWIGTMGQIAEYINKNEVV